MKNIKNLTASFLLILLSINYAFAQAPQSFNYQALVRNGSGVVLSNQLVNFKISLVQGSATGLAVYEETHLVTTDNAGLVNFGIGAGTVITGLFQEINWSLGPYFVKVEIDPNGGTSFVLMSTTQLLSVPYALYAEKSGGVNVFTFSKNFQNTMVELSAGGINNSWKGNYQLNYICGDLETIRFSHSALPAGLQMTHSGEGKQLNFIDTLTIQANETSLPGIYPITIYAHTSSGTKAVQELSVKIIALLNFNSSYSVMDTLLSGPWGNYTTVGISTHGPSLATIGSINNNQFTISNFGMDSVSFTADILNRHPNTIQFNINPQLINSCMYEGNGSFHDNGRGNIRYKKTCGSNVQYHACRLD
jgi:hypothetical protein